MKPIIELRSAHHMSAAARNALAKEVSDLADSMGADAVVHAGPGIEMVVHGEPACLRDQLAMAALQGTLASDTEDFRFDSCEETAAWCYKMADAMLEARGG